MTAVHFGGVIVPAASETIISPTQIIAYSPPGAPGTVNITVTDPTGTSATSSADQFTYEALSVTNPGAQSVLSGAPITPVGVIATDTAPGATVSFAATGLPAGLSISPTSGVISGTPSAAGVANVTVTATDNFEQSGSAAFTWTVTNNVLVTNPGTQSNVSGRAITAVPVSAADSAPSSTFTWSATGLPTGLAINSGTGTITGTPGAAGSYSVSVKATDQAGFSGSASFTWTITGAVSVTNPGNQSSATGVAITPSPARPLTRPGPRPSPGALPACLPGSSSTPARARSPARPAPPAIYTVALTATDGSGAAGTASFTWTVGGAVAVTNPGNQIERDGHRHHGAGQ